MGCSNHPLSIIRLCPLELSAYLALGQQIEVGEHACPDPDCERRRLGGWSGYWRWVRGPGTERLWIRRGRCSKCLRSHALLPDFLLERRLDVIGGDAERLELAATLAAEVGLEVWCSPFTCDLIDDEMLALLADCAERAERVRLTGAEVVFVTGGELSLLNKGFLPGETLKDRLDLLAAPDRLRELIPAVPARINAFLGRAAAVVRERFGGKITYASIPFEGVDWTPFDFLSVDLYRTIEIADRFSEGVRGLVARGKPVAITEFGSATYHGAADKGARGGEIIEWDGAVPAWLNGQYTRDEQEQATCLRELLEIFEAERVDTAFVYTLANYELPHRGGDPRRHLDLASYGVVKVLEDRCGETYPDMAWEPKLAFSAVAEHYGGRVRLAAT